MLNMISSPVAVEPLYPNHQKLLCWKSIFAGVLISIMSYMILTALGAGIGGLTASSIISNDESGSGLATGAGLWLGISAVMSLFMGGYYTLRISKFVSNRVGAAHGFVVASIFFIFMIWGAGRIVGHAAGGLVKIAHVMGRGAGDLSNNPSVQDSIHRALGNAQLKSDPDEVAAGLVRRLLKGDTESAKNYYAYETGLSQADVDAKVSQLKTDFDQNAKEAGEMAANAVADAGWSLFVTFLVGLMGAVIGGRVGAKENNDRPFYVYLNEAKTK
jgi:hypothetical protein